MHSLVEGKRREIAELCRRFGVRRLELFGSAASGHFDPASSDLDFIVEFRPPEVGNRADQYFGFLEALETLFERPVDLVQLSAVHNPYFLQNIESSRTMLYAA